MTWNAIAVCRRIASLDASVALYVLGDDGYAQLQNNIFVPDLDLQRLARCAAIPSRVEAVKTFRFAAESHVGGRGEQKSALRFETATSSVLLGLSAFLPPLPTLRPPMTQFNPHPRSYPVHPTRQ